MRKKTLVSVCFLKANAPYMSGEIAGFEPLAAKRFVDSKRAVYYMPPGEDQSEAKAEVKPEAKEEIPSVAVVPVKLSGPWYMVGDEKIKGKANAEARATELNEA